MTMADERFEYSIKRIIKGHTYNTETAAELAGFSAHDDLRGSWSLALFKTRYGRYFLASFHEDEVEMPLQIQPMEPEEVKTWLERTFPTRPDLLELEFGEMPEAGETESRVTLRMPSTLRNRLDTLSQNRKRSLNAWIIRCLESCATAQEMEQKK